LDNGPAMAVYRIDATRYRARPNPDVAAGPEFVLPSVTSSAPPYLHFALWAYRKEQ
jgi:hypothetical protein